MDLTTIDSNLTANIISLIEPKLKVGKSHLRSDALEAFREIGLPGAKSEEFKFTPITKMLEKNFSFKGGSLASTLTDINDFLISNLEANKLVFINGVYSEKNSSIISSGSEITIQRLEEAIENKNETALQHFAKYADYKNEGLTAWNTADWHSGVFINVPDNIIVEKPIIIYHVTDAEAGEVSIAQRNLIVIGKSSEVTVVEKFDSRGENNHFINLVSEVVVNENAGFNLYSIQNDSGKRFQYGLTEIYQKNSSRVNTYTFTLSGKLIRNNLHLTIDGEGVESHMYGLYLLDNDTLADNHTVVDHKKPNSFSNELYKGIMDGSSKAVFNGKIYVRPHAQKTNAFQSNRNILLTDKATINTKPQLEIWADDVKCSHGCTTGQLDEEALFYIQTRGISKVTARAIMLYAFVGELLDHIKHPVMKEYIDNLISERLHKNF